MVVLAVIFANFFEAEAGITNKSYDAVSDEMLVEYAMLDKDTIWAACNGMTIRKVGMDFIEKNIIVKNNIADPKKIRIGTKLKFRIKRGNFKDPVTGTVLAKESLVAKYPQITEMKVAPLLNEAKSAPAVPVGFSGVSKSVLAELNPPVGKGEVDGGGQNAKDSESLLEIANAKIKNLEKMIADKDEYILAMSRQQKASFNGEKVKELTQELVIINPQESVPETAVTNFSQERKRWLFVAGLIIIGLILYLSYLAIDNIRSRYNPRREKGRNGPNEKTDRINVKEDHPVPPVLA